MSDTTSKTPTRPDLRALQTNPESPGVLCLNGAYLTELVAYIEHLEGSVAQARQWIVNCVDPVDVGADVKQQMLDRLAPQ